MRAILTSLLLHCSFLLIEGYSVLTLAGGNAFLWRDGVGTASSFFAPRGLSFDAAGNLVVADTRNRRIRKISLWDRVVTTFAGTGVDGIVDGENATFSWPMYSGSPDSLGNIYVCDYSGQKIRRLSPSGVTSTFAGNGSYGNANGPANLAQFRRPMALVLNNMTGDIFVADSLNYQVRRITPNGTVSTVITFPFQPNGITIDRFSNLYVTDNNYNQVNKISPAGEATLLAGGISGYLDGQGTSARFSGMFGIAIDQIGNLFIADSGNHRIRQISPSGLVTTIAGGSAFGTTDGLGLDARFQRPEGIAVDQMGNIYVGDTYNNLIRMIVPCDGGYFVQNATCQICTAGTFSLFAQFNSSSCIPCGAGNVSASGSTSCSPSCGAGFMATNGSAACLPIPASTTLYITATMTTLLSSISASPNVPSNPVITLPVIASAMVDGNIVIYASASIAGITVLGLAGLIFYRRQKGKSQSESNAITPADHGSLGVTQRSVSPYYSRPNSAYVPDVGSLYRPTSGMQTNGVFGPQLGQPFHTGGWTGVTGSSGSALTRHNFGNQNNPVNMQFGQLPNVLNPTMYYRTQNTLVPGTSMSFSRNQTTLDPIYAGTTTFGHTRFGGNTATVVSRTLLFETDEMKDSKS